MLMKEPLLRLLHEPLFYLGIAVVIILFSKSGRAHINTKQIIKSYNNEILKPHNLTGSFIVAPIFISIAISIAYNPNSEMVNYIVTSVSILVSMFFWYISFFADYTPNSGNASQRQTIESVMEESRKIVNFEILESVFLLILSMAFPIIQKYDSNIYLTKIYSIIIYSCFINLIMNLLVLIKKHNALH